MKKATNDSIVIGFALFAMFFGAGNLIFPPQLGFLSGSKWLTTFCAFALTGIGLPMLGIFAVGKSGGDIHSFAGKVHPVFADILGTIIMLGIGPLLAMPRTAATTFEISVVPFITGAGPHVRFISSVIFFAAVLFFSIIPSKVISSVGKYLTPMLLLFLAAIIIRALIAPLGAPLQPEQSNFFLKGFLEGYQTMDALASMLFATFIMKTIKDRGYTDVNASNKVNIAAGSIAALGLLLVYGGLMYTGACSGAIFPKNITRTAMLIGICRSLWGTAGQVFLSIAMALACLTTAIGLAATAGHYFERLFKNKVSYRIIVIVVSAVSCWLANYGVENIIRYSVPLLEALYPVCIILTLMTLIDRFIPNRFYYVGGTVGTLIVSILQALTSTQDLIGLDLHVLSGLLQKLPLTEFGVAWVVPAAIFAVLFGLLFRNKEKATARRS